MSVATNNILKSLSDLSASSDKISEEFKLPPLSEWISIVKHKADSIAESENLTESEEIPTLMSYIGTSSRGPRASTVLTEIQRRHLHRNAKVSIKARKSRKSSIKTPSLPRTSNVKVSVLHAENSTPKLKVPPTIKKIGSVNVNTSIASVESKEATSQPLSTFAPSLVNGKGTALMMKDRSSKRKSSSELSGLEIKKPKINDPKEREKVETKQMKAKTSSLLPNYANIKSSVGMTNASVLKENRKLRSKLETKQDTASKNRKNIMALRQQKLEQNKKMREDKMEKTLQQRLKLEKEKQEYKLRSGREKTVTTPTPKKPIQKIVAESETKKTSDKNAMKSDKDKQTSVKKLKMDNKIGTSGILKTNERSPVKKNQKHETEKMLNSTFAIGGEKLATNSFKGKTVKEGSMKDLPKTPHAQTQKKPMTPSQKKGPESYAITPASTSFTSYDISEIRSDSEEEEEQEANSKPIPSWATGVRLRNALLQQHHHPIDTDELFGNIVDLPDLTLIMGISKKRYKKRTSSAVWNSSFS